MKFHNAKSLIQHYQENPANAYPYRFFIHHPEVVAMISGPLEEIETAFDLNSIEFSELESEFSYNEGINFVDVFPR